MAADIYSFLSQFTGGGARPNRYEVILSFPNGVGSSEVSKKIQFTCKATSIPATEMGVADVPYKGRHVKIPGDKTFGDWNVTILIDNDFIGRSTFEQWHNQILGFTSNVAADTDWINPINVYATAIVNQLDRADNIIQTYQIGGIFPTNVSEISLGYDTNDSVMEQQVTFAVNDVAIFDLNGQQTTS